MPREVIQALSPREIEILSLATEGLTDTAIANRLGISEGTVGTYWGRIRTKLGPFPRTELVAIKVRSDNRSEVEALERDREILLDRLHTLEEAEMLFEHVVDDAEEGVLILSRDGTFVHANPSALGMFGYSMEEIASRTLPDLVPPRYRDAHAVQHAEFSGMPAKRRMNPHSKTFALHRSGREFLVEIVLSEISTSSDILTACFVRPTRAGLSPR